MPHTQRRIMKSLIELRYIDRFGELQFSEIRSTVTVQRRQEEAHILQPVIEDWMRNINGQFLSMQLIELLPSSA
jgi:hypothetical protein